MTASKKKKFFKISSTTTHDYLTVEIVENKDMKFPGAFYIGPDLNTFRSSHSCWFEKHNHIYRGRLPRVEESNCKLAPCCFTPNIAISVNIPRAKCLVAVYAANSGTLSLYEISVASCSKYLQSRSTLAG